MIYYSNTSLTKPHMAFIGRWAPFHKGHIAIIQKKLQDNPLLPILILIRNTNTDPYLPTHRAAYIKTWMIDQNISGTIMIIPNIEGIYWGRGVGYKTEYVDVDKQTQLITGTEIRKQITLKKNSWKSLVATHKSANILSNAVSDIIEHGLVVWLTGCPSAGKTTLANAVHQSLQRTHPFLHVQILDGDAMRATPLANEVGFSANDRAQHIKRMAYLAKMFADHGILVLCAFVSPQQAIRDEIKSTIGNKRFIEIYVKATKKTRIKRDAKGMYRLALLGKLTNFTGLNGPYEIPKHPDVTCDTDKNSISENTQKILDAIFTYSYEK